MDENKFASFMNMCNTHLATLRVVDDEVTFHLTDNLFFSIFPYSSCTYFQFLIVSTENEKPFRDASDG